jgi:Kazal-type serine protease inhibitor domain
MHTLHIFYGKFSELEKYFIAAAAECNVACTMQWEPVCGTNAVTYGNKCQLESEACL